MSKKKRIVTLGMGLVLTATMVGTAAVAASAATNDGGGENSKVVTYCQNIEETSENGSVNFATSGTTVVVDTTDPEQEAEMYAQYEQYGLTYDKTTRRLSYEGKLVRHFEDILQTGTSSYARYFSSSYDDGEIDVHAIFSSNGELIGIEPFNEADFQAY